MYFWSKVKEPIEKSVVCILKRFKLTIAIAESCTGGLLCHRITNSPGCSKYFKGGIIAYNNDLKKRILGVPGEILKISGPINEETAIAMARGIRKIVDSDIGIATTGIAGPTGGSKTKPVGTVFIAISNGEKEKGQRFLFKRGRRTIKSSASTKAIQMLKEFLEET